MIAFSSFLLLIAFISRPLLQNRSRRINLIGRKFSPGMAR